MPYTLVQSGTSLYTIAVDGSTALLTLPSTVSLAGARPMRTAVDGAYAVIANTPTKPLIVDDAGIVLFMSPNAPTLAPTLTQPNAGSLTGTFGVKYTFLILDLNNNIIAESGFSPSASITITSKKITVSDLQTLSGLGSGITSRYKIWRRIYRTTNGTSTYFKWYDVEDNTTTTFESDASDASIGAVAAPLLGTAPYLSHIASFRDRLFGVNNITSREQLLYAEAGRRWAWPSTNVIQAPQDKGDTQSGITALMPRREALGVAKSNMLLQLTGTSANDFRLVIISTTVGAVNQESVAKYRDAIYFLGLDGVYRWDEAGLTSLTDGRVSSWFNTSEYFNLAKLTSAIGVINPQKRSYLLFLPAKNSTVLNRWIEYDIDSNTWWGPHKSDVYTNIQSAFWLAGSQPTLGLGTNTGFVAVETLARNDGTTDPIELNGTLAPLRSEDPPQTSVWGRITTEVVPQTTGTLQVYPLVGEPQDDEGPALYHPLTIASAMLGRMGTGRYARLRFYHRTINQIVQILGLEINPVVILGRRQ